MTYPSNKHYRSSQWKG